MMDERARRDLAFLNSIAQDERLTQRTLSQKLGIALGLTNIYLRRFVKKGYVKCVNIRANRILYLLTPQGLAEKSHLTYEFFDYSLQLYQEVRRYLRVVLSAALQSGAKRIALYGVGEAAELAYLSVKELGLEPVAIYDSSEGTFLGFPVRKLTRDDLADFDRLVVATFGAPDAILAELNAVGVPMERVVMLRDARQETLYPFGTDESMEKPGQVVRGGHQVKGPAGERVR